MEPQPSDFVIDGIDPTVFRRREWRRICKRARVGHRRPNDLRDTYASQLLTAGVQIGYISAQLGHSSVAVTADHYARWCGGAVYREPLQIQPGEVPADLLSRLGSDPSSDPKRDTESRKSWWSQRDLNPCLQGENLVS